MPFGKESVEGEAGLVLSEKLETKAYPRELLYEGIKITKDIKSSFSLVGFQCPSAKLVISHGG